MGEKVVVIRWVNVFYNPYGNRYTFGEGHSTREHAEYVGAYRETYVATLPIVVEHEKKD